MNKLTLIATGITITLTALNAVGATDYIRPVMYYEFKASYGYYKDQKLKELKQLLAGVQHDIDKYIVKSEEVPSWLLEQRRYIKQQIMALNNESI
jgi:hypothetical protein